MRIIAALRAKFSFLNSVKRRFGAVRVGPGQVPSRPRIGPAIDGHIFQREMVHDPCRQPVIRQGNIEIFEHDIAQDVVGISAQGTESAILSPDVAQGDVVDLALGRGWLGLRRSLYSKSSQP